MLGNGYVSALASRLSDTEKLLKSCRAMNGRLVVLLVLIHAELTRYFQNFCPPLLDKRCWTFCEIGKLVKYTLIKGRQWHSHTVRELDEQCIIRGYARDAGST